VLVPWKRTQRKFYHRISRLCMGRIFCVSVQVTETQVGSEGRGETRRVYSFLSSRLLDIDREIEHWTWFNGARLMIRSGLSSSPMGLVQGKKQPPSPMKPSCHKAGLIRECHRSYQPARGNSNEMQPGGTQHVHMAVPKPRELRALSCSSSHGVLRLTVTVCSAIWCQRALELNPLLTHRSRP
jgi:hypothetical protein